MKIGIRVWGEFCVDIPVQHSLRVPAQADDVLVELMGIAWFDTEDIVELQDFNYYSKKQEVREFHKWLTSFSPLGDVPSAVEQFAQIEWPVLVGVSDLRGPITDNVKLLYDGHGQYVDDNGEDWEV